MLCPVCHFDNFEGEDSCSNCGADLATESNRDLFLGLGAPLQKGGQALFGRDAEEATTLEERNEGG